MCVNDAEHDFKNSVFKVIVYVKYKFRFFLSSNQLLVGGRLVGGRFVGWQVVGQSVVLRKPVQMWVIVKTKCFDSFTINTKLKLKSSEQLFLRYFPAGTQYSGNIHCVFPQRCYVRNIQGTFREHFKGKDFFKSFQWKSCFCLKSV